MNYFRLVTCLVAIAIGAEAGARLDDYLSNDIPFSTTPSIENLWLNDYGRLHGKPNARFKAIALNNVGIQGPDIDGPPISDCPRVLFLGSSETFGHPNVKQGSYPDRVAQLLTPNRCVQILNAAIPGMTAGAMIKSWDSLSTLQPQVVFIYPSTLFYLSAKDPKPRFSPKQVIMTSPPLPPQPLPTPAAAEAMRTSLEILSIGTLLENSRFYDRLKDTIELPDVIQRQRDAQNIARQLKNHDASWVFTSVPDTRLQRVCEDISDLIDAVKASGAMPILLSQAIRITSPSRPEDEPDLRAMRVIVPRASEPVLAEFPYRANYAFRRIAAEKHVQFVDTAAELSGRREDFVDMVHFSPEGREVVAHLVSDALTVALDAATKEH